MRPKSITVVRRGAWWLFLIWFGWLTPRVSIASETSLSSPGPPVWEGGHRADRVLVKFKAETPPDEITRLHTLHRTKVLRQFPHLGKVQVLQLPDGLTVREALRDYQQSSQIEYAEPDYQIHAALEPNDPFYVNGTLWGLHNTGQNGGTAGVDIGAPAGWEIMHSASNIIVAVIDSGVRYTHEDLAANMWVNPGEIDGNGQDDDHNGYIDDVHGIDVVSGSGDPSDDFGHGTHVAGIIGAVGNNGLGIVGVAWQVKIMALKFLDKQGDGSVSGLVDCLQYARKNGATIINASWGDPDNSVTFQNAIAQMRDAGIIIVAAAGNNAQDLALNPFYPAAYSYDHIITVTAITQDNALADYANYSATLVHLAAPGSHIYSTWNNSDSDYAYDSGTSMAVPYVTGIVALLRARFVHDSYSEIIQRLLAATDPVPALAGKTVTGGRANLQKAIGAGLIADFIVNQTAGSLPFQAQFTNTSLGAIQDQVWDFGDGSAPSHDANPSHLYGQEGDFTVSLTVTGTNGATSAKSRLLTAVANYQIVPANYSWIAPSPATNITLTDDGVSAAISLPFTFYFYGRAYDEIFVGANGLLGFNLQGMEITGNLDVPQPAVPNAIICPYWDNLNPAQQGSVQWGVVGTAPERMWVVSWVGVPKNSSLTTRLTFQAALKETSQQILFQYLEVRPDQAGGAGRRATVGLEMESGLVGVKYAYNGQPALLTNQQALLFIPGSLPGLLVNPTTNFLISGPAGGPFSPGQLSYTLENMARSPIHWVVTHAATWLEPQPHEGTLDPRQQIQIGVVLNTNVDLLPAGAYPDTLQFLNVDGNTGSASREVLLTIRQPAPVRFQAAHFAGPDQFLLQIGGEPGARCQIDASTNLVDWIPLDTPQIPLAGTIDFFATNTAINPQQFYRVRPAR